MTSITPTQLGRLQQLIDCGAPQKFYTWSTWRRVRARVLKLDNYECQMCKAEGRYRRGLIVHHVKHLTERPDLALSIFDPDTGQRQLVTVCKEHHELEHPESLHRVPTEYKKPVTEERWD